MRGIQNEWSTALPHKKISLNHGIEGVHRERQIEIAVQLFDSMGIAWDDKDRRRDWAMRGFRQFDAPVSIVVTCDKTLEHDTVGHFDCGAVLTDWCTSCPGPRGSDV